MGVKTQLLLPLCLFLPLLLPAGSGADTHEAKELTELTDREWRLTALEKEGAAPLEPLAEAVPTVTFMTENEKGERRLVGHGGCNRFGGAYLVGADGALSVPGPFMSTRMACPEPIMNLETAVLQALQAARSYALEGDALTVRFEGGILRFSAGS